jgi:hypothetical protein
MWQQSQLPNIVIPIIQLDHIDCGMGLQENYISMEERRLQIVWRGLSV